MLGLSPFVRHIIAIADLGQPLALLATRIWVARVFFYSGLTKIADFDSTIQLFQYEYQVPLIPPALAAYVATFFELSCPILLALGLGARFAALPLLAMTAVIQLTYVSHLDHLYWALLLSVLLCFGAGKFSFDEWIRKRTTLAST